MQCVRIRDNERRKLQRKVAFLRSQVHANNHHFISPNATPPKRCIVIGTDAIDEEVEALLNLGPSFAVSSCNPRSDEHSVVCLPQVRLSDSMEGEFESDRPGQVAIFHCIDTFSRNIGICSKTSNSYGAYTGVTSDGTSANLCEQIVSKIRIEPDSTGETRFEEAFAPQEQPLIQCE
ncbi:hypothetical protein GCK32_018726 [Trichostrongylus colubriformis]|uniref:Uncharacterized protein n=1 Tax=Trichostrongylus colubriformis TaxID=6319 RepID=A0AAN8FGN1_TRICO